jgi:hypothetical protein
VSNCSRSCGFFADLISLLEKKLGFGPFHPNIAAAAKPRGQIIISTTIFRLLAR